MNARATFLLLFFCLGGFYLSAQSNIGLVAFYRFNSSLVDGTGNSANTGIESGLLEYDCGLEGEALLIDGANDFVRIPSGVNSSNVNSEFDTEDFSISFYFKPIGRNGIQYLVSKRDTACDTNEQYFFIRYNPTTRVVSAQLREGMEQVLINAQIVNQQCWQHVVLIRRNNRVTLFLNGQFAGEQGTSGRIDIENTGDLLIGSSNCRLSNETTFNGLIDEFRIYDRALSANEARGLYTVPDRIVTENARLFLGESLTIDLESRCSDTFGWFPAEGVAFPDQAEPTITPSQPGPITYRVQMEDLGSNCVAIDSINIQVIDPDALDCTQIFLPKAFTPNNDGPAANETFGISNPFAIPELLAFEIFDRWGSRVFATADPFARWDGLFRDEAVDPGVFLYRIRYICNGEEVTLTGSVVVLI